MLENIMNESSKDTTKVYEVGYLLVPTLPSEKVSDAATEISGILSASGAVTIDEEAPSLTPLAYEMQKASGSGHHERFNEGYFGWIKFECPIASIEGLRKAIESKPEILRALVISTIREKTYLGKRSKSEAARSAIRPVSAEPEAAKTAPVAAEAAPMTEAQIAKVDESIDQMVKGV